MILRELVNKITFQVDEAARRVAEKKTQETFQGIGKVGSMIMGTIGTLAIGSFFKDAEAKFVELRQARALVANSLLNIGGQSGKTLADLSKEAKELSEKTLFRSSEVMRDTQNNLLAFGSIQGEVFTRASKDAIDLGAKLGSLPMAAKLLGMALEHPEIGVTRLTRAKILFTKAEKDAIKAMVDSGQTVKAQEYILSKVESKVKNTAKTLYDSADGWTRFKKSMDEMKESFGEFIAGPSEGVANFLKKFVDYIKDAPKPIKLAVIGTMGLGLALTALAGPLQAIFFLSKMLPGIALGIRGMGIAVTTGLLPALAPLLPYLAGLAALAAMLKGFQLMGKFLFPENPNGNKYESQEDWSKEDFTKQFTMKGNFPQQRQAAPKTNIVLHQNFNLPYGTQADHVKAVKTAAGMAMTDALTTHIRNAVSNYLQPAQ